MDHIKEQLKNLKILQTQKTQRENKNTESKGER